jgi:predicted nucleic acid-binding protein
VQSTLTDSGPLIALFDCDDKHHRRVRDYLKTHKLRLVTTWPILTEVCAVLPRSCALDFMEFVARGGVAIEDLLSTDVARILDLLRKYADLPADLADVSLVALAERSGRDVILSLDSDFAVYRLAGRRSFRNLLAGR